MIQHTRDSVGAAVSSAKAIMCRSASSCIKHCRLMVQPRLQIVPISGRMLTCCKANKDKTGVAYTGKMKWPLTRDLIKDLKTSGVLVCLP